MSFEGLVKRTVITVVIAGTLLWLHGLAEQLLSPLEVGTSLAQARDAVPKDHGLAAVAFRWHIPAVVAWALFFVSMFVVWVVPFGKPGEKES